MYRASQGTAERVIHVLKTVETDGHNKLLRPDWLSEFEQSRGRPLRVLHVGNIANNAFINAKVMRKIGIDADVVCYDYYHIMGTPEWEEAELKGDYGDAFFPDWWHSIKGYTRPEWFYQGPKKLCQETLAVKFTDKARYTELIATLRLATDYISFRDSKLSRKGTGTNLWTRAKRRLAFIRYVAKAAYNKPTVVWSAAMEWFPVLKAVDGMVRAFGLAAGFSALVIAGFLNQVLKVVSLGRIGINWRLRIAANMFKWRLKEVAIKRVIRPLLPFGSRLYKRVTGYNFSERSGQPFIEWFRGKMHQSQSGRLSELWTARNKAAPKDLQPASMTRSNHLSIIERYLRSASAYSKWVRNHKQWHATLSDSDLAKDIMLANGFADGWENVFSHYDVVQCYSTDGIAPMAMGHPNFFNYEHGTLRSIPFEDNSVGRLTATAYRLCTKVMLTNLDNYISCDRLEIPDSRIVPLPHALDDEKIHRFIAARPHIRPDDTKPPLFFSSARQHWKDTDPNYAKGNDIFLHAAAKVVKRGLPLRIMLVEWGRDLEDSKRLIADIGLEPHVTWVPTMTGEELWERYLEAHAIVDQFIIPAFGRVTFDSLTIGRRVISNLDIDLATRFFGKAPPMMVANSIATAEKAILKVVKDPQDKAGIGRASAEWARKYHSSQSILDFQLEAYRLTLGQN